MAAVARPIAQMMEAPQSGRTSPRSPQSPRSGPQDDAMDVSPTATGSMRPPNGTQILKSSRLGDGSKKATGSTSAASTVSNPKVVQSAFVHKLYNMLEDDSIKHLITWSSSNDSFLMNPSTEFSKVLSTYFKHTNVSSFVRQLNMYGFHKVSDVFHNGQPETPYWEFKHGGGSFKKGDLDSLRDIKRRASRHALIHRDSFSAMPKPAATPQQPPLPDVPPETTESRLGMMEQSLYDLHTRLARSEESNAVMAARCQELTDRLAATYQHNSELSGHIASLVDDHHPVRRSISHMQNDIQRQLDSLRKPQPLASPNAHMYLSRPFESHPTSPIPYDDRRRASIQVLPSQNLHRPLAPSPIRHDSIGTARSSPGTGRLAPPPVPGFSQPATPPLHMQQPPIPSVAVEPPPYLPRRHTSADIHSSTDWSPSQSLQNAREPPLPSPFPNPNPFGGGDRQLQDKLASYSFGSSSQTNLAYPGQGQCDALSHQSSRAPSPPPGQLAPPGAEPAWAQPPPVRMPFRDVFKNSGMTSPGSSEAPTRRSSMANIHSIMNPTDPASMQDYEEEQRKRKRQR